VTSDEEKSLDRRDSDGRIDGKRGLPSRTATRIWTLLRVE
jgi:hypothetical protein